MGVLLSQCGQTPPNCPPGGGPAKGDSLCMYTVQGGVGGSGWSGWGRGGGGVGAEYIPIQYVQYQRLKWVDWLWSQALYLAPLI